MEADQQGKTSEQIQHEANKLCREALAWAHFKIGVTPLLLEEHNIAMQARGVLEAYCMDLQKKIELVEPPAQPKEKKAEPYVMDLTHLKGSEASQ